MDVLPLCLRAATSRIRFILLTPTPPRRFRAPRCPPAPLSSPSPRPAPPRLRDPLTQEIIDEALVLWFPAPHSETGEDVAELQLHGGRAVIAATLAALGRLEGLRPAGAGEVTP